MVGFFSDQEQGRIWHYHKSRRHGNSDVPDRYETVIQTRHNGMRNVAITVGLLSVTGQSIIAFLDITRQKELEMKLKFHEKELVEKRSNQAHERDHRKRKRVEKGDQKIKPGT